MCNKKEYKFLSAFHVIPTAWEIGPNLLCPINTLHKFVIVLNYFWFLHCFTLPVLLFRLHHLLCVALKQALPYSYFTILVPQLGFMTESGFSFLRYFIFSFVSLGTPPSRCNIPQIYLFIIFFPQQHFPQLNHVIVNVVVQVAHFI